MYECVNDTVRGNLYAAGACTDAFIVKTTSRDAVAAGCAVIVRHDGAALPGRIQECGFRREKVTLPGCLWLIRCLHVVACDACGVCFITAWLTSILRHVYKDCHISWL
jgi:hypothetical protein